MHKALIGIAAAATLGLATVAAPSTADARCFGCAVGAGVAAGLIGGALIGGAIANNPPPPPPAYYPPPAASGTGRLWAAAGRVCSACPGLLLEQGAQGVGRGLRLAVAPSPDLPVIQSGS